MPYSRIVLLTIQVQDILMLVWNRQMQRFATAGIASLLLFILTFLFSHSNSMITNSIERRTPIARLTRMNKEILTRSNDDVLWHPLELNDDLYAGDSIRTGSQSTATIEFLQQKASINVDENSMVLLEESEGQVAVDFLDGSLLVNTTSSGRNSISVKSGDQKLDLSSSSVSLNKNAKGEVDVSLVSGNADNSSVSEQTREKWNQQIKILNPTPGQILLRTSADQSLVSFEWATKTELSPEIQLLLGDSAHNLIEKAHGPSVKGQMALRLAAGNYFWKLKSGTFESATTQLQIVALSAPKLLGPVQKADLPLMAKTPVQFSWSLEQEWPQSELQIAADEKFQQDLKVTEVSGRNSIRIELEPNQKIFWRILASIDKEHSLASDVGVFQTHLKTDLASEVALLRPYENEIFPLNLAEASGIRLSWQLLDESSRYQITLQKQNPSGKADVQTFTTSANRYQLLGLTPGSYTWQVGTGNISSKPRHFEIHALPTFNFQNWSDNINYSTDKPNLTLEWERGSLAVREWHLRLTNAEEPKAPLVFSTTSTHWSHQLPRGGHYSVEVEGVDANGELMTKSNPMQLNLQQIATLGSPRFESSIPNTIRADARGYFHIAWTGPAAATEYVVTIRNSAGEKVDEQRTSSLFYQFRKMKPGNYSIAIHAIDGNGRAGAESELRSVVVDQASALQAPQNHKVTFDDE